MPKETTTQALKQARKLAKSGKQQQAIDVYQRIINVAPRNKHAKSELAQLRQHSDAATRQTSSDKLDDETLAKLRALIADKNYPTARQETEALITTYPASALLWDIYATALHGTENMEDATNAFQKACSLAPDDTELKLNLAMHYRKTGQMDSAIPVLEEIIALKPDWVKAHLLLASTLKTTGQITSALTHYKHAVELDSNNAAAHNNLGVALMQSNQISSAINHYKEAIEIRPEYAQAYFNLGNAYKKLERSDEALNQYNEAIRIDQNFAEAWLNLGKIYHENSQLNSSIDCYKRSLSIHKNNPIAEKVLTKAFIARGDADEAQEILRKLLQQYPKNPEIHFLLGRTLNSQGRVSKASQCYSRSLELHPSYAPAFLALCELPLGTLSKETVSALQDYYDSSASELSESRKAFLKAHILSHNRETKEAWSAYIKANEMVFSTIHIKLKNSILTQIKSLDNVRTKAIPNFHRSNDTPTSLFILAPSCSGKTSLELMLGTSPHVIRQYESRQITLALHQVAQKFCLPSTMIIDHLPNQAKIAFFEVYKKQIQASYNPARILTDTSPGRISNAWDLADQLPKSYFIFIERDPLDTAIAIFQRHYRSEANFYAYHPDTIRDHLIWYRNMRETLMGQLGKRAIKIQYADLMSNPKSVLQDVETMLDRSLNCEIPDELKTGVRNTPSPYRELMKAIPKEPSLDFLLDTPHR